VVSRRLAQLAGQASTGQETGQAQRADNALA